MTKTEVYLARMLHHLCDLISSSDIIDEHIRNESFQLREQMEEYFDESVWGQ